MLMVSTLADLELFKESIIKTIITNGKGLCKRLKYKKELRKYLPKISTNRSLVG